MKMTKTIKILGMVLCLMISIGGLQAKGFTGSIFFDVGFPQGEFNDVLGRGGIGLTLSLTKQISKSPIHLGLDLNFLNYGNETTYEDIVMMPGLPLEVVTSNNIFQMMGFLRFQPLMKGSVQPYFDALVGFNYLWTATHLQDEWDEEIASDVNYDDYSLSYGIGTGMMIRLINKNSSKSKTNPFEMFLDMRVRYIFGGQAEYLKRGSITLEYDEIVYQVYESRTDLLTFMVGLTFSL